MAWTKLELVIFLAGVEAFHTLSHIMMAGLDLPITFTLAGQKITLTRQMNILAIVINALLTLALLLWASRLKTEKAKPLSH